MIPAQKRFESPPLDDKLIEISDWKLIDYDDSNFIANIEVNFSQPLQIS